MLLIPFVPRSIARDSPPVCLERWKAKSIERRWANVLHATCRIAFWATLAKIALRSSWKTVAPIRERPSKVRQYGVEGVQPRIAVPATVNTIPLTELVFTS